MRTEIGEYFVGLRVQAKETLKTMATKLEVSSAFLSAVENGKKRMPETWIDKLEEIYNLSKSDIEALKIAELKSREQIEIKTHNANPLNKDLAVTFARKFEDIDEETAKEIMKLLHKEKK